MEVFEANMEDAGRLLGFARALANNRKRRMRRELRDSVGAALGLPKRDWKHLDCVESADVFVVLKPAGSVLREHFDEQELRPLLRQTVVAISASVESYVSEKAKSFISEAWTTLPERMKSVQIELGEVLEIETKYKRKKWGYRELLETYIDREASPDPAKIGIVFSTVGKKDVLRAVDAHRAVAKGKSDEQLRALYQRRNRIAHAGDRKGHGRATLSLSEVEGFRSQARSIVEAMEATL
jgi:hypothetical protein